jgi:serine/threonine protein kinase/tetratricopeptide (TPR) repeat protein
MSLDRLVVALADRYRIERELGQGGMATVYLADDLKHKRKVAIKVLRPELAEALGAERFLREIETTANLRHPHILPLYDSGDAGGFLFYVMPLVEGESLRDRLEREKQLPLEDALQIAREVADALSYAHGRGIVHRDIKPENILLEHGHAVVADFGIARAISAAGEQGLTQTGMAVGTPMYMSPEQAAGEKDLDGRSDLYSLACMLYEMLAGQPPFTGPTVESVVHQHIVAEPRAITQIRPAVPAVIAGVLQRALAKNPADRFNPVAQFSEALRPGTTPPAVATAPPSDRSIGILPFVNLSADPENEYFSDGLTEELIADLARVKALRVISRTSSMLLKGTTKGIRAIGTELGVRYVLEGSVRRAGNALRITAQLIDADTDAHLWSEKYTGTLDDVFDLQERVSRAIVDALDVTLSSEEDRRLTDRPIRNVRAFELYLQARQAMQRYQLDRGTALLEQAIAIEGEVPALRALRAYGWNALARMGEDRAPLARVEREADALIADAPDAPYGYALRGFAAYERGDLALAVRSFRAAEARDPNDADVLFYMGISLQAANRDADAAAVSARLMARDPLSPFAELLAGANTWFVGRGAEGIVRIRRGLEIEPASVIAHWALGYNCALAGRLPEAAAEGEWMREHAPHLPYTVQLRALVAAIEGRKDEALTWLRTVDWAALDSHHTFHLSESFAMAGDTTRALELLERAVDNGFYTHDFFAVHCPFLAPLRGMAEFERILAKARRRVAEFDA